MKLVVIGFGQCGGRVADEFARLNRRSRSQRGIDIITGMFAVNTDAADLSGLASIRPDYQHRILIGGRRTGGHGVGKINELGAEIAKEDADKIVDAMRTVRRLSENDAFLLIASAAGGTGSGALPILTQHIKERYIDKPVYCMVILPFEHEESSEARTTYNTAICLKSINAVADAVFLVDNQRYIRKDFSLKNNLAKINSLISEPFYNLLCAGEEKKAKYIGARTVDAGDIIQTLSGWSAIGYGRSESPMFKRFRISSNFRNKGTETHRGIQVMDEAVNELSIGCNPANAGRTIYLVSGPAQEINMDVIKELGNYLRDMAPNSTVRDGDYPREKRSLEVTLVLSELSDVTKIREYYTKSTLLIPEFKRRQEETASKLKSMDEVGKDIPTLL